MPLTMKQIEEMRNSMMSAGKISMEDIEAVCELNKRFTEECDRIAEDCAAEGYPSHGSNYELRCESLWENNYKDEEQLILEKYQEESEV